MKPIPEAVRHYFWSFFGAVGMICFWAGVWEGIGELPILDNPLISLAVGMAILIASGFFFKEFDPLEEAEKSISKIVNQIRSHPRKEKFHIRYYDKISRKNLALRGDTLKRIEKGFIVLVDKTKKETFVPIHRVTEILHQDKTCWKH